jgi:hypothetical protein
LPRTQFSQSNDGTRGIPVDHSSDNTFRFESDKSGCVFQWRLLNWGDNTIEQNWTTTAETTKVTVASAGKVTISWLTKGFHRFRVRAVDAAGHTEERFREGENQLTWYYTPPIPYMLILGILGGMIAFSIAVFLEIRRRRRKAAMERYAIKRMRRKFKGAQKGKKEDVADWKKDGKIKKKGKKLKSGETHHKHKKGEGRSGRGGGAEHKHEHRHHGHKHHTTKHKGK